MSHLSPEKLGALLDGALEATARHEAERHLESCDECRELLAGLRAQDQRLARALEHDPGEAYFETFADRVTQRIRSQAASRAAAAPEAGRGWWGKWLAPQRLVLVSSTAAVVVVAVMAYVLSQQTPIPRISPELGARQELPAPAPQANQAAPEADQFRDEVGQKKSTEPAPAIERREAGSYDAQGGAKVGANKPLARASEPQPSVKALDGRTNAIGETRSDQVAAQTSRRNAADRSKLVPVSPRGEREEVPMGAVARDAAPAAPGAVPAPTPSTASESNAKTDRLESAIRTLKERAAAPLEKRPESGAVQGFAAPPLADDAKNLRGQEGVAFAWTPEVRSRAAAAESLAAGARRSGAAVDHDAAASAWTRVRVLTTPRSAADLEARCRIADERHAAWRAEPTRQRHDVAVSALRSALELLPSGARRSHYAGLLSGM